MRKKSSCWKWQVKFSFKERQYLIKLQTTFKVNMLQIVKKMFMGYYGYFSALTTLSPVVYLYDDVASIIS